LEDVEIEEYDPDPNCFTVNDESSDNKVTLCSLLTMTGISLKANRDNWVDSIEFFQEKCNEDLPIV